jgi:hypothetical protein
MKEEDGNNRIFNGKNKLERKEKKTYWERLKKGKDREEYKMGKN